MGFFDSIFGSSKTTRETNTIPQYIKEGGKQILKDSTDLIKKTPVDVYRGQTVAGPTQNQKEAWKDYAKQSGAVGDYAGHMGMGNTARTGQQFMTDPQSDISKFFNPYEQRVVDSTIADMETQKAIDMERLASAKMQGGAYGGSRHGVQEGFYNFGPGGYYDRMASTLAGIRNDGWNNAYGQAVGAHNARNDSARLGLDTFNSVVNQNRSSTQAQEQAGERQRNLEQQQLDRYANDWQSLYQQPFDRLTWQASLLNGIPYETGTSLKEPQNPLANIAKIASSFF